MSFASKYSLQRTMIVYFLLIGFASLLVCVEFILETHSEKLEKELLSNLKKYSEGKIESKSVFAPIDRLRKKAILMIAMILAVMVIVLTMFIKNITEPLQHIIELSRKISGGDLSQTITIHAHNELSELGNVINEMSGNIQEITLLSKNLCESGIEIAENISADLDSDKAAVESEIGRLKAECQSLSEVIQYFDFYTIEPHES